MHQLTHCHTLSKPFFKIFLFRIYAPTIHSTDIDSDETSVRHPQIHAPIQPPQTNPPTTLFHKHTPIHAQTKPQIPRPYSPTNAQQPQTLQPHCPTDTNPTQNRPRRRCRRIDVDADDAAPPPPAIGQARHQAGHTLTGRVPDRPDQARPDHTKSGQAIGFAFAKTSAPVSANFFAKPDRGLICDASRAVVDAV